MAEVWLVRQLGWGGFEKRLVLWNPEEERLLRSLVTRSSPPRRESPESVVVCVSGGPSLTP